MALDILVNATTATVTTGGTTAPAAGTVEQWTVTQTGWPSIPSPTLQTRLLDKVDLGSTSGYEIMLLQNIAATSLTAALVSGTAYTTLDVEALPQAMDSGDSVILGVGATTQTVVLSAAAAAGAVSLAVTSFTASAAFAIGTPVTDFTTPGANLNGSVWTVERGVEGTTPKAHAASWTVVPAPTEKTFDGRFPTFSSPGWYGDGSDGDVTITTGVVLSRDMYYNNLTIGSGGEITPFGQRIFVRGTFTGDNGGLTLVQHTVNGGSGGSATAGGSAGGGGAASTVGGPASFGASGGTAAGNAGSTTSDCLGANGGAGGNGSGGTGGAGGVANLSGNSRGSYRNLVQAATMADQTGTGPVFQNGGAGGGGGAGDGTTGGGGGGCGACGVVIFARFLAGSGSIVAAGAPGGAAYASGNGGGGGGGGGGYVVLVTDSAVNPFTLDVSGGAGGAGAGTGSAGAAGSTGNIILVTGAS